MKFLIPLTLLALSNPLFAATAEMPLKGCAAKQQGIQSQLAAAQSAGNSAHVAGLKKALAENTDHCTDASLQKEREHKVLDARHEVAQRQSDLDKAMKKGDADKINTRKEKLAESRKELQNAIDQLDK